jgi:tetratricopeptide (TPR) repeat protein
MTHKETQTDLSLEVTATELEKDMAAAATSIEPAGVTALALDAKAADAALGEPLSGFRREQQELTRRQRAVADRQSALLEKRIARVPSLPHIYFSWRKALLGHQQYQPAIEKLSAAHERGPHWADPLKLWGDALVALGKKSEALTKYDEALMCVPKWDQLINARHVGEAE